MCFFISFIVERGERETEREREKKKRKKLKNRKGKKRNKNSVLQIGFLLLENKQKLLKKKSWLRVGLLLWRPAGVFAVGDFFFFF